MLKRSLFINLALGVTLAGRSFVTAAYSDEPGGQCLTNPVPVTISRQKVTSASRIRLELAPGGGQAIQIRAAR